MNQSTSFAQVATNLLNVLQGYTKGIRFVAVLTMLLTIGIGQMWGDTYERLTSIADIDESAQYVLGVDGTGFHYSGTSSWGKTALPANQTPYKYTLKKAADGQSFTAKTTISGTTYYLQIPKSNTFSMSTSTGTNTDIIIGTTTNCTDKAYAVANKSTTARHLRINGSSGLRSYAGTTGTIAFFYKVVTASKTLSSIAVSSQRTEFTVGDSFEFGGTVTATYSNSTTANVTSSATFSGYNMSSVGEQTVTVSYTEGSTTKTATYNITVSPAQGGGGSGSGECTWELVTDASTLKVNDEVIITSGGTDATKDKYALSTNQKSSNRGAAEVTKNGNTLTDPSADVQVLTLKAGSTTGTWAFYTGSSGYLYAASSSANQLKTKTVLDGHGSWTITIEDKIASIVATGSSNRNVMQYNYNNGSPLFACYASATQTSLAIYKKVCITETTYTVTKGTIENCTVKFSKTENDFVNDELTGLAEGDYVHFTITPGSGCELDGEPLVKDASNQDVECIEVGGVWMFQMPASDVTVSVSCVAITQYHTVTFDANDHGTAPTAQTVESGQKATEPTAPTATGYIFGGWYKESECTNKFDFNTSITADITLYAKWTPITYTVSFDNNGGTGTMANQTFTYNQAQTLTANTFTRTGYTFNGWNTKSDGSGDSYTNSQSVKNLASTNGATITLYAQWKIQTFTVAFDKNGGTGTMANQTFTYNQAQTLTANAFTRTGYTFTGWNTKSDGSGNSYTDKQSVTLTTAGLTLYAQWKANTYTVAFNANGGTGTMSNQSFTYGQSQSLTANAFTRTNYAFKNWNTKADGSGTAYTDEQSVSNLTTTNGETVTLYAQWAPVYTITWMVNGQVYNEGNPTTTAIDGVIENIPTPPAYNTLEDCGATKFMGWSESNLGSTGQNDAPNDLFTTTPANPISKNKTFYAVFATAKTDEGEDDVTTTFDFTSGYENATAIGTKTQDGVTITFGKGDNNSNKPTYYDSGNAVRVYAKNTITVACTSLTKITFTFGSGGDSNAITANTGSFTSPTWTGTANSVKFTIGGSSGNRRIQKVAVTYTATTSVTTYSNYVTNCCNTPAPTNGTYTSVSGTEVKLTWNGDASRYHITCSNPIIDTYTTNTSYEVSSLTECEEYTFYVSADPTNGCESPKLAIEVTPYIPKTVTFEDGSTTTQKTTSCGSETVTVPTASKDCYTSVWKDQSGNEYTNNQEFTPTENMTLTAQYTIIKYEITFKNYDGTVLQTSTIDCGTIPTPPANPTREQDAMYEYEFAGWTPNIEEAKGNRTYTATYNKTKRTYTVDWYVNGKLVKNETVEAGESATAPDLSKNPCGAVLAGWTDAPNGEYVHETFTLYPGEKPSIEILENKTLYAVFADIDE